MTGEICSDNRFELIEKYKKDLFEHTNIQTSKGELDVLDSILFRCWQMGWLDKLEEYDRQKAELSKKDTEIDILIRKKEALRDEIAELKADVERLQKNCQQMDAEVSKLERELAKNIVLSVKYIPVTNERICAVGWDSALVEKIKTEAIKEFAERLKEKLRLYTENNGGFVPSMIDNLVKEMTE